MDFSKIDAIANSGRWAPRWGWHDDHRHNDRKPEYLPAMQQVRSEFMALVDVIADRGLIGRNCLQLGMGEIECSHDVWRALFSRVVTIDFAVLADQDVRTYPGLDTKADTAIGFAALRKPFDFLFIDAGHKLADVQADHRRYGLLVRPGGVIAFHDSAKRPGYEDEIDVWRYLLQLESNGIQVNRIGDEVGIAWVRV